MSEFVDPALQNPGACLRCYGDDSKMPCPDCNSTGLLAVAYDRLRGLYTKTAERAATLEDLMASKVRLNKFNRRRLAALRHRMDWLDARIASGSISSYNREELSALAFATEVIITCGYRPNCGARG